MSRNMSGTGAERIPKVIYVLISYDRRYLNDRVSKIVSLRRAFDKMILVTPGRHQTDDENLVVRPINNPTGVFRLLKLTRLKKAIDRHLFFPSPKILYVRAVIRKLKPLIRQDLQQRKNVCLLTSLPSHDLTVAGLELKQSFPELWWIIDWQDLWSYDENYYHRLPTSFRKKMVSLERQVLTKSNLNITTNSYAKLVLEQHYGVPPERVVSINHHFDRSDLGRKLAASGSRSVDEDGQPIRIGFLGTLFKPPRVPGERVLCAIDHLRQHGFNAELHLYGNVPQVVRDAQRLPGGESLVLHGRSSHRESLEKVATCDFLLLALADLPNCRAVMSIKLPHYLMVGKLIIAIVPDPSAIADIVRETRSGFVIPSSTDWGEGLREIFQQTQLHKHNLHRNEEAIQAFSWDNISEQWLQILGATAEDW